MKHIPWQILIALLAGLGLGLAYSWLIAPSQFTDANPSILRSDFKDQYRAVIAAAYASSHDLDRARARLGLLGDADPVQALSAQAQQMLASGESFENVRLIAQLTSDIQQGIVSIPPVITPTEVVITPAASQTVISNETPPDEPIESPTQSIGTPFPFTTSTPRPTLTPIPPPGKPFELVGNDVVCDLNSPEGLLQVTLMDSRRRQVPGMEIIVTWNGGEDNFFTGFKPEVGDGYADFQMAEAVSYSVRVVQGGTTVPDISIPICTDPNGQLYKGGILLTFQQP